MEISRTSPLRLSLAARLSLLLGCAVAGGSGGAAAAGPIRRHPSSPPWLSASGFPPPPRPLASTKGSVPLFPRARGGHAPEVTRHNSREASMQRHPAGRGCRSGIAVVRQGDTLWDISAAGLGTDNSSRIARYLPAVIHANRRAISDPDLIFPGQNIHLPDSCDR